MTPVLVIPGTDFVVCFEAEPEDISMRWHFVEECGWTDAQYRRTKNCAWFCANVSLYAEGELLGTEYLGCCCYKTEKEFYTTFKNDYFADMVRALVDQFGNEKTEE